MTDEEWYIRTHHMGRWPVKDVSIFEQARKEVNCNIKIYPSHEAAFIWLIAVDKGESYKYFWIKVRQLQRKH